MRKFVIHRNHSFLVLLSTLFFMHTVYAQNIGVGTYNPEERLHVYDGNLLIQSSIPYLILSDTTPTNGMAGIKFRYQSTNLAWIKYNIYDSYMQFSTYYNGTRPDLILDGSGKVGIGTLDPDTRLHVNGGNITVDNDYPWVIFNGNSANSGNAGLYFKNAGLVKGWMYYSMSDNLIRLCAETSGLRNDIVVSSEGDVGIGTGTPMGELHILGDTVADLFLTPSATGSSYDSRIVLAEDNDNTWGMSIRYDGGVNQLRVFGKDDNVIHGPHLVIDRDGGNVGIGVADPIERFEVDGNISCNGDYYAYSPSPMAILDNTGTTNQAGIIMKQQGTPAGWMYYDYNYDLMTLNTDPVGTRRDLVIDNDGNVGIGLFNPSEKLHVSGGDIKVDDSYPFLYLNSSSSSSNSGISFSSTAGDYCSIFYNNNLNELTFSVGSSTPDAAMNSSGYLGLGTTDPATRLHVYHTTGTSHGLSIQNSYDSDIWHFYVYQGNDLGLFFNGTVKGTFDDVTGNYAASSDRRLKKNIEVLEPVVDKILRLTPRRYYFNSQEENEQKHLGFIAQEVAEIFPSMVNYQEESDLYTLDYSGFGVLAIKAIQEQQYIIDRQQEQIDALMDRIEKLENK